MIRTLFATCLLFSLSSTALACSCPVGDMDQPNAERAAHIFVGKVLSTHPGSDVEKGSESSVAVSITLKGNAEATTSVWSGSSSSTCSARVRVGAEYLFFVGDDKIVGLCTGTRPYNRSEDNIRLERIKSYVRP